jgi:hypothetical protein
MPLKAFIAETMSVLQAELTPLEICVKNVHGLRFAAEEGRFDATFNGLNEAMAAPAKAAAKSATKSAAKSAA